MTALADYSIVGRRGDQDVIGKNTIERVIKYPFYTVILSLKCNRLYI